MSQENAGTAVCNTPIEAENAVHELQRSGFDLKKLSLAGKDPQADEKLVGFYNLGNRMQFWGEQGAFWGGMWGLLFGSAFLLVPKVGPLLVAGPLVASIIGGLERAVVLGGLGALGAALYSIGIPKDSVLKYEAAIMGGKYMLVVHGTVVEVDQAKVILTRMGHEVQVHCAFIPA